MANLFEAGSLLTRTFFRRFGVIDKAISEPSIEEEEIKAPMATSKTMSCRKNN